LRCRNRDRRAAIIGVDRRARAWLNHAMFRKLALAAACAALASPSAAQRVEVDVELMLAVDISRSMDIEELKIQRAGYIAALNDPQVHRAIAGGMLGRIAISYVEWAGAGKREQVIPWTLIDTPQAARDVAEALTFQPVQAATGTSISDLIGFGMRDMERNAFDGLRRVIDISGDGPNNTGVHVTLARDAAVAAGVTINGLPLMMKAVDGPFSMRELDRYYEDCVVGGPLSFVLPVWEAAKFAETIRRKLILEIAGLTPPDTGRRAIPAQLSLGAPPRGPRIDCLIGEKLRARWMRDGGWEW
jgi:hypothetical protein